MSGGWWARARSLGRSRPSSRWDGTAGRPRSANGASSLHLRWDLPSRPWVEVSARLEVVDPPKVAELYFWALQVSFVEPTGRSVGGAHLGLQWYPAHPRSTAVNWGGYRSGGGELAGGPLGVPSATGNANTGDYPWKAGTPYRLLVRPSGGTGPDGRTGWRGSVLDVASGRETVVRELWGGGTHLSGLMVWSEVFAPCDAARCAVRWSDLRAVGADGEVVVVRSCRVNYQRVSDGGCRTTDAGLDGGGWLQVTGTPRKTTQDAVLALGG